MSVQPAQQNDAPAMARVLYEGLRNTRLFGVLWPTVCKDNWLEVQADYCQQHIEEPNSVAFVSTGEKGALTGMIYGRILTEKITSAETALVDIGIDTGVLEGLDDEPFQKSLIEKYGGILYIPQFAVLPEHQGKGLGRQLMQAVIEEAKGRRMNVALASAADAVGFYTKFGFSEVIPPRMLAEGKVAGPNQMLLELFPISDTQGLD